MQMTDEPVSGAGFR